MSQSLLYHAFGVREGYDCQETIYQDGCIRFVLSVKPEWICCPACGGKEITRKGRRFRELQTVPIGFKPVFLVAEVPKCQCAACGKRFEAAPLCPGLCPLHAPARSVRQRPAGMDDRQ
jgi:transposase